MSRWIALLRAVNVGQRRYPMAELRSAMEAAGYGDVATHIQTGNVRFTASSADQAKVAAELEQVLLADRGFEVAVVLLTPEELTSLAAEARGLSADLQPDAHYIAVTAAPVEPGAVADLGNDCEQLIGSHRAVHWLLTNRAFHESKLSLATLEKAVGTATVRNLNMIGALADKWGLQN